MPATAPQTSVTALDVAAPGTLVGANHRIEPATNEEAAAGLAFGIAVKRGTAANAAKLPVNAADVDNLVGVVCMRHAYNRDTELDTDGVQPGAVFGLLRRGEIRVLVEDSVTPASEVHVRLTAGGASELAGQFRGTVDGNALVVADFNFTANAGTDEATATAHGLTTGDGPFQLTNSGGALPAGLSTLTNYWVVVTGANTFKFATSLANALLATPVVVDITGAGTGTHTVQDTASTERVATANVSKFCSFRSAAGAGEVATVDVNFTKAVLAELG